MNIYFYIALGSCFFLHTQGMWDDQTTKINQWKTEIKRTFVGRSFKISPDEVMDQFNNLSSELILKEPTQANVETFITECGIFRSMEGVRHSLKLRKKRTCCFLSFEFLGGVTFVAHVALWKYYCWQPSDSKGSQ